MDRWYVVVVVGTGQRAQYGRSGRCRLGKLVISDQPFSNQQWRQEDQGRLYEDALTRVNWFVCLFLRRELETFGGVFVIGLVLPCFASLRFVRSRRGVEVYCARQRGVAPSLSSSASPALSVSFDSYELFNA